MSKNMQLSLSLLINGLSPMSKGLEKVNAQIAGLGKSAVTSMSQLKQMRGMLGELSTATKLAAGLGIAISGQKTLAGVVDLERSMLVVKSNLVSGASSANDLKDKLQQVRDTARELSSQTIFSDAQMVDLTGSLLKSGVSFGNLAGASFGAASLAQLGGITPELAASQLGALGNAFSFKSSAQFRNLSDQISRVDDASAMNSGMLLYNAQQVAATAASHHIAPAEMFSALGYLDVLGGEAGTSLNRFIGNMAGATPQKQSAMKELGLNFWQNNADGSTTMKPLNESIELVRETFKGMKDEKARTALGHKLFGEEGERAANLFFSKDQSFKDFQRSVEKSSDAATKLKIQTTGLGASFDKLKNATFSKFDTQFSPVRDAMTATVDAATRAVEKNMLPAMLMAGAGATIAGGLAYKKYKNGKANKAGGIDALGALGGEQRVFVTNFPSGMMSPSELIKQKRAERGGLGTGGASIATEAVQAASKLATFKSGVTVSLKLGAPLTAALTAYQAYGVSSDQELSDLDKSNAYKKLAGEGVGSIVGGAIGGGIGALFGGVGAIPGAMIGSALGGMAGGAVGGLFAKTPAIAELATQLSQAQKDLVQKPNQTLNYSPTITIQGNATPEAQESFSAQLKAHQGSIQQMMLGMARNKERVAF